MLDILLVWSSVSLEVNPFKESLLLFSSDFLFSCIHPLHSFTRCLFPLTFRVLVLFFFSLLLLLFPFNASVSLVTAFVVLFSFLASSLQLNLSYLPSDSVFACRPVYCFIDCPCSCGSFFFFPLHLLNIDHCVHHVRPVLCCLSVFICECLTSVSSRMLWRKTGL